MVESSKSPPDVGRSTGTGRATRVVVFAVLSSSILATVKVLTGIFGNSYALIADGVESLLDIVSSLVAWGSLRIAAMPPDTKHPYGHGKAEPLGALVVSVALLAAAVGIAVQSIREILLPHHAPEVFTLPVLLLVVATKEVMFRLLKRTGEDLGSVVLKTDAWHHRSDGLTSLAAFVGISVSLVAGEGYEAADDWAALFACAVIAFNGARLLRQALDEVMDAAPPPQIESAVREIAEQVPGVRGTEKCRVRKSGLSFFVDLHLLVDGDITVRRGHDIAHDVTDRLIASHLGITDVSMHVEPWGDHEPTSK